MKVNEKKERVINGRVLLRRVRFGYFIIKPLLLIFLLALVLLLFNRYFLNAGQVNHELILKYSQALSWPIIIFLVYFIMRPYLPDIVDRAEEVWGIKLKPKQPFQPEIGSGIAEEGKRPDIDITTIEGRARLIENNFEVRWLLEKSYRIAYGTQIQALNLLRSSGPFRLENIKFLYEKHVQLSQVPHPDIDTWLLYLLNDALISKGDAGEIAITDIGRLFLEYLASEGISDPVLRNY